MPENNYVTGENRNMTMRTEARGAIYVLLSRIFLEPPDNNLIERLRADVIPALIRDAGNQTLPEEFIHSLEDLLALLQAWPDRDFDQLNDMIASDYTLLFRGLRPGDSPPPPYESLYRNEGVLFGESTQKVRDHYSHFGVGPAEGYEGEPPDHIGLELAFLGYLCEQETQSRVTGNETTAAELASAQAEFLSEHLSVWVGTVYEKVRDRDRTGFYSAILRFTVEWIKLERNDTAADT